MHRHQSTRLPGMTNRSPSAWSSRPIAPPPIQVHSMHFERQKRGGRNIPLPPTPPPLPLPPRGQWSKSPVDQEKKNETVAVKQKRKSTMWSAPGRSSMVDDWRKETISVTSDSSATSQMSDKERRSLAWKERGENYKNTIQSAPQTDEESFMSAGNDSDGGFQSDSALLISVADGQDKDDDNNSGLNVMRTRSQPDLRPNASLMTRSEDDGTSGEEGHGKTAKTKKHVIRPELPRQSTETHRKRNWASYTSGSLGSVADILGIPVTPEARSLVSKSSSRERRAYHSILDELESIESASLKSTRSQALSSLPPPPPTPPTPPIPPQLPLEALQQPQPPKPSPRAPLQPPKPPTLPLDIPRSPRLSQKREQQEREHRKWLLSSSSSSFSNNKPQAPMRKPSHFLDEMEFPPLGLVTVQQKKKSQEKADNGKKNAPQQSIETVLETRESLSEPPRMPQMPPPPQPPQPSLVTPSVITQPPTEPPRLRSILRSTTTQALAPQPMQPIEQSITPAMPPATPPTKPLATPPTQPSEMLNHAIATRPWNSSTRPVMQQISLFTQAIRPRQPSLPLVPFPPLPSNPKRDAKNRNGSAKTREKKEQEELERAQRRARGIAENMKKKTYRDVVLDSSVRQWPKELLSSVGVRKPCSIKLDPNAVPFFPWWLKPVLQNPYANVLYEDTTNLLWEAFQLYPSEINALGCFMSYSDIFGCRMHGKDEKPTSAGIVLKRTKNGCGCVKEFVCQDCLLGIVCLRLEWLMAMGKRCPISKMLKRTTNYREWVHIGRSGADAEMWIASKSEKLEWKVTEDKKQEEWQKNGLVLCEFGDLK